MNYMKHALKEWIYNQLDILVRNSALCLNKYMETFSTWVGEACLLYKNRDNEVIISIILLRLAWTINSIFL